MIGQEGYDGQKFIEIAGAAAEGVLITTSLDRDSEAAEARAFIETFERGSSAESVGSSGRGSSPYRVNAPTSDGA